MAGIRQPDDERIPVAAPRPPRTEARRHQRVDATGTGLTLIAIAAILAALGDLAARQIDLPIAGALVGGFLGVLLGFAGIYRRYRDL
jgi:L-alanine-DL-glutamate epimerase-like enolase superfamily enzyme